MPGKVIAVVGIDTLQDLEESYTPQQIEEFVKPFKADFRKATENFLKSMFVENTDPGFIKEITDVMSSASADVGISALQEMFNRP